MATRQQCTHLDMICIIFVYCMTDMHVALHAVLFACVSHLVTAVAAENTGELFFSREEFLNFFKIGGTDQVSQYAEPLWNAGQICHSSANLLHSL